MKKIYNTFFGLAYAVTIIFVVIISSVPPVSRDAQTHHLALPKIWLTQGFLTTVHDMDFSYYPQLIDMLYYLPVKYDVDIVAKYLHFSFALATTLLIIFFIRRYIGVVWGLLGGLMFLTLPIIIKLSVTVYVDLGLLFFFTASFFSILIWLENTEKIRWLILAGICSGLAISTKYNAMLSVTVLALLFGFYYLKNQKNQKNKKTTQIKLIKYFAIFSFVTLLISSPWFIRNYNLTGNPVYPLYQSVFSQSNEVDTKGKDMDYSDKANLKPMTLRRLLYHESFPYILAVPLRIFYEGEDDNLQYFDGKLNPLLLFLPFFLFLSRRKIWQNQILSSFVVITLLYTLLAIDMRIRYIITIISPMIVLSVFGLNQLNKWLNTKGMLLTAKVLISLFVVMYFLFNISYGVKLFNKINPMPYLSGEINREEYLSKNLVYYPLDQMANQVVPENGKLLGIYTGNRRYYLDVPLTLDSTLLFALSGQVSDVKELVNELSKRQLTHILVRLDLFQQELSRRDLKKQQILVEFFKQHVKLLSTKDVFALYQIVTR